VGQQNGIPVLKLKKLILVTHVAEKYALHCLKMNLTKGRKKMLGVGKVFNKVVT